MKLVIIEEAIVADDEVGAEHLVIAKKAAEATAGQHNQAIRSLLLP